MTAALAHHRAWIFDIDYTLYGPEANLFEQVVPRITEFVGTHLGLAQEAARAVQREYYLKYGSTMRGMALHHGVDPKVFSSFVHDINYGVLTPDPALKAQIAALPGRKFLFTNATLAHGAAVLAGLGLSLGDFDGAFDVEMADWTPKPDPRPYAQVCERFAIDHEEAVFFEDTAKNLATAQDLGWGTVWIKSAADRRQAGLEFAADLIAPNVQDALTSILAHTH